VFSSAQRSINKLGFFAKHLHCGKLNRRLHQNADHPNITAATAKTYIVKESNPVFNE